MMMNMMMMTGVNDIITIDDIIDITIGVTVGGGIDTAITTLIMRITKGTNILDRKYRQRSLTCSMVYSIMFFLTF